jgi:DNA-binding XRE family transcriptional regulator
MRRKDPAALKRARKRAGLTQKELGLLVRCSQTMIYLLEKPGPHGIDTCSDDLAREICRRLSVDVEDLFEQRGSASRPTVSDVRRRTSQASEPEEVLAQ